MAYDESIKGEMMLSIWMVQFDYGLYALWVRVLFVWYRFRVSWGIINWLKHWRRLCPTRITSKQREALQGEMQYYRVVSSRLAVLLQN